jgi:hypothetical protein
MIYDVLNLVVLYIMNCIMVLIWKLPNISTIQKPYNRSLPVPMASFVDALRPEKFSGVHFKRWSVKVIDWLTAMEVFWVKDGLPEGDISDEDRSKFQKANDIFVGVVRNDAYTRRKGSVGSSEHYLWCFKCRQGIVYHEELS